MPIPADGTLDTESVALVTGGPDFQTVIDEVEVVRVPAVIDCHPHERSDDGAIGCCPSCSTQRTHVRADWLIVGAAFALAIRRKRGR